MDTKQALVVTLEPDPVEKTYLSTQTDQPWGQRNPQKLSENNVEWIRNDPQQKQNWGNMAGRQKALQY